MQGKIIKGIAGFYYVHVENDGIYECKAKGIFRNKKIKPLVGDNVQIEILDKDLYKGSITDILPRKNELIRPASANIDQAMVIFALKNPQINYNLLNRFLVMMQHQSVPTVICFNKCDIADDEQITEIKEEYEKCGCRIIFTSTINQTGIEQVNETLRGKTTVLAGPSGVGKSSMTNLIIPVANMQTGDISRIGRGRHTTRHSQIFNVCDSTYIMDTPGFTSLDLPEIDKEDMRFYFPEFADFEGKCRFNGCVHVSEPDCKVKEAVEKGVISGHRYNSYVEMFNELKEKKKY